MLLGIIISFTTVLNDKNCGVKNMRDNNLYYLQPRKINVSRVVTHSRYSDKYSKLKILKKLG